MDSLLKMFRGKITNRNEKENESLQNLPNVSSTLFLGVVAFGFSQSLFYFKKKHTLNKCVGRVENKWGC